VNTAIDFVSIVLGGLAAGTVLFVVSVGLSVTMGLMGFVNLAHGAFAMFTPASVDPAAGVAFCRVGKACAVRSTD